MVSQPDASLERVFLGQFLAFLPNYNLTSCLQQRRPWFPEPGPHQDGLSLEFPPHPGRMEGLCFLTWSQIKFKGRASSGWASCSTLVGMLLPAMQRVPLLEYTKQSWVWRSSVCWAQGHYHCGERKLSLLDLPGWPFQMPEPHPHQSRCQVKQLHSLYYVPHSVQCINFQANQSNVLALWVELRYELGVIPVGQWNLALMSHTQLTVGLLCHPLPHVRTTLTHVTYLIYAWVWVCIQIF